MEQLLLVDKPEGISSFDVIRILRRSRGAKNGTPEWKMGHAGTLDPFATGLLIIAVGGATKKLTELIGLSKEYVATVRFGESTTTGDPEGDVLERKPYEHITQEAIHTTLFSMKGALTIQAPIYSAIKKAGKPLYAYARAGEAVVAPLRTMRVDDAELISFDGHDAVVRFAVGSGTYIRSLAEELGKRLGTVAHCIELRRTRIGDFKIEDAMKIEL